MKKLLLIFISFTLIFTSYSQTGPGGVGSSTNNVLWLNADSILQSDSSSVGIWPDISGNGNDANQSTSSNQAQLVWNAANSHRAVYFDGNSDFYNINHITSDDASIFIVYNNILPTNMNRYGITTQNHNYITAKSGNPNDQFSGMEYSGSFYVSAQVASKFESAFGQTEGSSTRLLAGRRGYETVYTRAALNNNAQSMIGALYNGVSASGFHKGDIAEVVMFNDTLTLAERRIVMNALTAKYGNNMLSSSMDYYKFQNLYSHDIIGIGQESDGAHSDSKGSGVVQISNADDMVNGEYLMVGHNNLPLDTTSSVPAGFTARWERVWRIDQTGDVGTVTLKFHIGNNGFGDLSDHYVLIDNDGNFQNGGTTQHDFGRSVDGVNGTVSFANVYLPEGYYFTLGSQDVDNYIESVQSGNWEDPNTWDCTCVPTFYSEVSIVDNHVVELNDNREVNSLTILDSATLNLNPSTTFNIYSFLNVHGTMNNIENAVHTYGGDNVAFSNFSSNPVRFYNLIAQNYGGLVFLDGNWEIENIIRAQNSNITNNADNVTILSTSDQTAQILKSLNFQNAFNGNYIMERYISPRQAAFVNIASPTTTTIADWDQEIYMSGVGGNDGNAQYNNGKIYYSVYGYDNISQSYDTIKSTSHSIQPGYGYELFLGDDLQQYTPTELGIVNVIGDPTSGSITRSVNQGFNLLGNPYQGFLNWGLVNKPTDVSNSYYVFNANNGNYQLYTTQQPIPPAQAFWVEKTGTGIETVTFNETNKTTVRPENSSQFLRLKPEDFDSLRIVLSNDVNPFWHEHILEFSRYSSLGEDEFDHGYLPSRYEGVPAIYSSVKRRSDDNIRNLMINSLSKDENMLSISLTTNATVEGNYIMKFNNLEVLNEQYNCILLEDKKKGSSMKLSSNFEYKFYSEVEKTERFVIHFGKNTDNCSVNSFHNSSNLNHGFKIEKYYGDYYLYYDIGESSDIVNIRILDALGRIISETKEQTIEGEGNVKISTDNLHGIYLIQVQSKNGRRYSDKFYF